MTPKSIQAINWKKVLRDAQDGDLRARLEIGLAWRLGITDLISQDQACDYLSDALHGGIEEAAFLQESADLPETDLGNARELIKEHPGFATSVLLSMASASDLMQDESEREWFLRKLLHLHSLPFAALELCDLKRQVDLLSREHHTMRTQHRSQVRSAAKAIRAEQDKHNLGSQELASKLSLLTTENEQLRERIAQQSPTSLSLEIERLRHDLDDRSARIQVLEQTLKQSETEEQSKDSRLDDQQRHIRYYEQLLRQNGISFDPHIGHGDHHHRNEAA